MNFFEENEYRLMVRPHTEIVNHLRHLIRCLVDEHLITRDTILPMGEHLITWGYYFTYGKRLHRTVRSTGILV